MSGILILYASLGTGHKSAAFALDAAFQRAGHFDVRTVDLLDCCGPVVSKTLQTYYIQSSERGPKLYKLFYEVSDKADFEDSFSLNRLMSAVGGPFLRDLDLIIDTMQPDAIVCTMQLPLQHVVGRKQQGRLHCPIYVVVTDFVAHSTWFAPEVTSYFVPSDLTRDMMCRRGAEPMNICVTGIPVALEIADPKPASAMREKHGFSNEQPLVTLFGGGIETERVMLVAEEISKLERPMTLAVVAGRNEQLAAAMEQLADGEHVDLHKLGTIDYVDDLIAASDLVITKAGGLIVSEVLARGTPMVVIEPLPGQEEWNADLVAATGAGVQLRIAEMVPPAVEYLTANFGQLMAMRRQAQQIGRPHAAVEIATKITEDLTGSGQGTA